MDTATNKHHKNALKRFNYAPLVNTAARVVAEFANRGLKLIATRS